jgi:hypothetical protein
MKRNLHNPYGKMLYRQMRADNPEYFLSFYLYLYLDFGRAEFRGIFFPALCQPALL